MFPLSGSNRVGTNTGSGWIVPVLRPVVNNTSARTANRNGWWCGGSSTRPRANIGGLIGSAATLRQLAPQTFIERHIRAGDRDRYFARIGETRSRSAPGLQGGDIQGRDRDPGSLRRSARASRTKSASMFIDVSVSGAPGRIRTSDPQIRSLVLYPAELRAPIALRAGEVLPAAGGQGRGHSYRLRLCLARRVRVRARAVQAAHKGCRRIEG